MGWPHLRCSARMAGGYCGGQRSSRSWVRLYGLWSRSDAFEFVSVLIFYQRTALGICLYQQLMVPVTSWSGGNSPVCFLLAHLLGICRDTWLTGAKTGWLIEAKSLSSPLLLWGGAWQGEREFYKCKCWCGHVHISEHSLEVGSLFPMWDLGIELTSNSDLTHS